MMGQGHAICRKCCWLYLLPGEAERQTSAGARCSCMQHCPCRGLCGIGCACEPTIDRKQAVANWERRR